MRELFTVDNDVSKIIFEIISSAIDSGEEVTISGFGKFYPKQCQFCKRNEVAFKGSVSLKQKINDE